MGFKRCPNKNLGVFPNDCFTTKRIKLKNYSEKIVNNALEIVGNKEIKEVIRKKVLNKLLLFPDKEIALDPFVHYQKKYLNKKTKNKSPKDKTLANYYLFKYANDFFLKRLRENKDAHVCIDYENEKISMAPLRSDICHEEFDEFIEKEATPQEIKIVKEFYKRSLTPTFLDYFARFDFSKKFEIGDIFSHKDFYKFKVMDLLDDYVNELRLYIFSRDTGTFKERFEKANIDGKNKMGNIGSVENLILFEEAKSLGHTYMTGDKESVYCGAIPWIKDIKKSLDQLSKSIEEYDSVN